MKKKIDEKTLRQMVEKNPDITEGALAKHFGATRQAVSQRLHRLKIRTTRIPVVRYNLDDEEVRDWFEKNPQESYQEGSKRFKCSATALAYKAKRLGFDKDSSVDKKRIEEVYKKNPEIQMTELAEAAGCSPGSASKVLAAAGLREKRKQRIDKKELAKLIKITPKLKNKELAEHFGTTVFAISKAKEALKKGPNKNKKTRGCGHRADDDSIAKIIQENPDSTLVNISKLTGFCLGTIGRIARKYKLQKGHKTCFDHDKACEEYEAGKPVKEIAKDMQVSEAAVRAIFYKRNIPTNRHHKSPPKEKLERYFQRKTAKNAEAAKHFGVSVSLILKLKTKYGIRKQNKK